MDNQHRKIIGYRELTEKDIAHMNMVKEVGASLGKMVAEMELSPDFDKRWLAIAKTDLQKGFMALTRSIAKPDFF